MLSFNTLLFTIMVLLCVYNDSSEAFTVARTSLGATCNSCTTTPTSKSSSTNKNTVLKMGLFDMFQPPKPVKKAGPKQDQDVFAGRGKKITIREDEDSAMWVDEPKSKDTKKKGK